MTYKEINREEIERRRDRLLDHFGETPIRERHDTPSADRFEEWIEMSNAGYIGSAYALVRRSPDQQTELTESMAVEGDERERVLLILGRGSSDWGVPGGGQENDETLINCSSRSSRGSCYRYLSAGTQSPASRNCYL
ncbi:hypothetical protein ACFQJ8_08800 [Halocatena marina]|uniref:hypothetical protein n=1 Tax=Halocatena marina TaxID=2934937 RepID=UPI00360E4D43